jgi:hypothetical protein
MPQNFLCPQRDQPMLMPVDMREWLPEDDLAFVVLDALARRAARGGRVASCGWAPAVSAGLPAVRLSGLRWWRRPAGELRDVVEVAGFA